jgi:gamma-glutamyltranspeptidase
VAAIGASGGSQIISSTAQTIIRMFDMDLDTHAAIHSPRFHHQLLPDVVVTEARESEEIKDGWKSRGHAVNPRYGIFSGVSAVKLLENGEGFEGSGDERKQGSAVGY